MTGDRERAQALIHVSRETWQRLEIYVDLLQRWQKTINLVSASTLPVIWTRHIADCLQLLTVAPHALRWADLGSGGGLPGVVLAIALAEKPGAMVDLFESDARKCAFLREALRVTGAPGRVHHGRIEASLAKPGETVDAVTARALAPLPRLLELAYPLLKKGACGVFLKGQDVEDELTKASKSWMIQSRLVSSVTDPRAQIVVVEAASPR